jgi:predicted alpha-1,6-mannanase (GH76 family)
VKRKRSAKPVGDAARPIKLARTATDRAVAQRMLDRLRGGADVRTRKVRRIKAAIKVRHYENALKLAVALERMARAAKRLRS